MSAAVAAMHLTAARPAWWAWAIAGFFARGGIILFALPILALPTPIGVANFFGADAVTLNGPAGWVVVFGSVVAGLLLVGIVAGALVGAFTDRLLVRAVAPSPVPAPAPLVRLLEIRLLAVVPVIAVAAWLAPTIAHAGYSELILPDDLSTPYLLRVLSATRDQVALILGAWVVAETIGGLAVRHAVLSGCGPAHSIARAMADVLAHPLSTASVLALTVGSMTVALVASIAGVAVAWDVVTHVAGSPDDLLELLPAAALLVAVGMAAVAVVAIVAAWRSASWTLEVQRHLR